MSAHDRWTLIGLDSRVPSDLRAWMPAGTELVITRAIERAVLLSPRLIELGRIGLIDGPSGAGKSQLLGAVQAACPHRTVRVQPEKRDHGKRLDVMIHTELTGHVPTGTEADIERANAVEICRTPTLLIIDEAQLVSASTLLSLRRMQRDAARPFGLLFAGIGMVEHAERDPSLATRRQFIITVRPMVGPTLIPTLARAHPLLAAADPDLLLAVDHVHCHGQWRAWMILLENHQNTLGPDQPVTRESMATVLEVAYEVMLPAPLPARAPRVRRGAA